MMDRTGSRRGLVIAFGAGIAAAAVTISVISIMSITSHTTDVTSAAPDRGGELRAGNDSILPEIEPGTPCVGADRTGLPGLLDASSVPIWTPDAGAPPLTGTWLCAGDIPALAFESGTVYYEPGWESVDVKQKWADLVSDSGGHTQEIDGHLALVQPAAESGTKPQVMIVRGDTLVRILGDTGAPAAPLLDIADSLSLETPGQ